jgi:hypothetical protein
MIRLGFTITNPWSDNFDSGRCWSGNISKNKWWELQLCRQPVIAEVQLQYSFRQDHAGLKIDLGLFGHSILFNIYDSRHWNTEQNRWNTDAESRGDK